MAPEQAMAALERIATGTPPRRDTLAALGACVADHWPAAHPLAAHDDPNLVARPCGRSARDWHLEHLRQALDAARPGPGEGVRDARARYHARWLTHLFDPGPATVPKVSIVIPIYNRAWLAAEAVETCLAQSYRNLEIVVVDDGSTDDPASALAPYHGRITLVSQANGGVSAARNAGIAAATGEFIQFLDSDNLLHPDSTELKVRAFAAVPDADLCTCASTDVSLYGVAPDFGHGPGHADFLPVGDATCATRDLMASVSRTYPFAVSSVLLPRWVLLDVGPWDTDLPRQEDMRFWFRLGLRGTKVIGLRQRLFHRCRMSDGLSVRRPATDPPAVLVCARGVVDLLDRPMLWPLVAPWVASGWAARLWDRRIEDPDAGLDACRAMLLAAIAKLAGAGTAEGLSPLPVLVFLWLRLDQATTRGPLATQAGQGFHASLARALLHAIEAAPAASARDEAAWRCHRSALNVDDRVRAVLATGRLPPCAARHRAKVRAALAFMRRVAGRPKPASRPSLRRRIKALRSTLGGRRRRPTPKVSLVVPALGDEQAIEATLRSCLRQSHADIEVMVLDADVDRSRRWSERFRDVRCVRLLDPEGGLAFTRNVAAREATGQLVRLLEPGVSLAPDEIREDVRAQRRAGGDCIALAGSSAVDAGPTGRAVVRPLADLLAEGFEPPLSAMLVPRRVIEKVRGFDVVLGQAHERRYLVRLAAAGVSCALYYASPAPWNHGPTHGPVGADTARLADVANLVDALHAPRLWPCLPVLARRLVEPWPSDPGTLARDGLLARQWRFMLRGVAELGDGRRPDDRSPLPALALCLGGLAPATAGEPSAIADLRARLLDAAATAAPMDVDEFACLRDLMVEHRAVDLALTQAQACLAASRPDSPLRAVLGQVERRRSIA